MNLENLMFQGIFDGDKLKQLGFSNRLFRFLYYGILKYEIKFMFIEIIK